MADIKIPIGSDGFLDDDGDERGKRGHRGRRGHDGPTGPTGSSGSTGPFGPTGDSGEGLVAYGYAVGANSTTIQANANTTFDLGGLAFPNFGITPPAPTGNSFTILSSGDYEYDFYVVANHDNASTIAMEFAIFVNGVSQGAAHEFRSNQGSADADSQVVRGEGIIHLLAGDVVTLRNRTSAGTLKVDTTAGESCNRTLTLKKLSA